jgi:hypothetical protein
MPAFDFLTFDDVFVTIVIFDLEFLHLKISPKLIMIKISESGSIQ